MGNSGEGEEGVEFGGGWRMDRWNGDEMRWEVKYGGWGFKSGGWRIRWMDGWMDRDFIVDEDGTSKASACQIELRSRSQTSKLDFTKEW